MSKTLADIAEVLKTTPDRVELHDKIVAGCKAVRVHVAKIIAKTPNELAKRDQG
jgi:hypothetical protein